MPDHGLITIGQFARLSGLSVHSLRHCDDVGLLAPAVVDHDTGYRRYRRDQIGLARLIVALRWVDLPIHQIRPLLASNVAPDVIGRILRQHRQRLVGTRA